MDLSDLNYDEKLALVGLFKLIIQADDEVSDGEREKLRSLTKDIGRVDMVKLVADARARFPTTESVKTFAESVTRQSARAMIFDKLHELAEYDDLVAEEQRLLDWLTITWSLAPEV